MSQASSQATAPPDQDIRVAAPMARVEAPAHIIRDDQEALAVAHRLAERFQQESAERDRERRLPRKELDEFSQSGLMGYHYSESIRRGGSVLLDRRRSHGRHIGRRFVFRPDSPEPLLYDRSHPTGWDRGAKGVPFQTGIGGRSLWECLCRARHKNRL